jgi:hypothetical protein
MLTCSGARGSNWRTWLADVGLVGAARRGDPARGGGVGAVIWAKEAASEVEWRQNRGGGVVAWPTLVDGVMC